MNTERIDQWTSRLLIALAGAGFVLSYAGMLALAIDAGFGWLAYLWPIATETAVIIFSLVYLVAKTRGYHNRWLMPLIIGCTGLSVAFNIVHAPTPGTVNAAAWALPPLLLFAAFKTFIWLTEQDTRRAGTVAALADLQTQAEQQTGTVAALTAEIERLTGRRDALKAELDQAKRNRPAAVTEDTRNQAYAILAERSAISGAELGRLLGKSDRLGRRLKREFEAEAEQQPEPIYTNGNGVQR